MRAASKKLIVFIIMFFVANLVFADERVIDLEKIQTASSTNSGRIWNLQDADILSVINEVSQSTGKNFIVDPRVSGKISLISSKPLKDKEVYQVFLTVLSMLGYSALPSAGGVVKIIPNMESGEHASKVVNRIVPGKGEEIVVRVVPLENVSATQLIPILRPMLPQWSNIASYGPGNVLVLLGRADNLQRIVRVIRDVDKASSSGVQIIHLRHASAQQVGTILTNLQNAARAAGEASGISIAVDERTNSILMSGTKASRLRIGVLIADLDAPAATSGNTDVIYLRYLKAKKFAPVLAKIAENMVGKGGSGGSYDTTVTSSMRTSATSNTASASKDIKINSGIIQFEQDTNALIITAPPALMRALKIVIAKLDIRPAEVLVEAIIAEIDESNMMSLGIQWGSINSQSHVPITSASPASFPSLGAGVFGIIPGIQIQALLSALRSQNGVDILSTPSVIALDNQKAFIEIGQAVPTENGSYTTAGSNVAQPFNTIEYKNVTLKLEVTPQINLNSSVKLQIKLKNDSLQNPQSDSLNPLINTSKIENSVLINSDDILVLGGLIKTSNNDRYNRVPILSSIPIIGTVFTQKATSQEKKNLVVFIKPIIIHNGLESMSLTHTKYVDMRSTQSNFRDEIRTIGDKPVNTAMAPWKNEKQLPSPFPHVECPNGRC